MNYTHKNKILKFVELLREAHEDDELELNDILIDLKDELIEFEIHKGYFSKQALGRGQRGEKVFSILHNQAIYEDDKYCFCIEIKLDQLQDTLTLNLSPRKLIKDKKIFTIFRELHQVSERYDDCFIHINTGNTYNPSIYLFILIDTEVDKSNVKFLQIYKEIKSRNSSATSDFSNDTTVEIQDDKIVISSSYDVYTDRKFRNLIRVIDLSDFKIEKTIHETEVINIISKK